MRRIVIVGGGYAGFYTAWRLEKRLRPREAELVIIDPRPYMTYQPFLPEVAAGSIEARHAAVSLRSHLRRTRIISGAATMIRHAEKTVTVRPVDGPDVVVDYDIIVVTAGAVTRVLPIPGADEVAIGMKHVEEAVAIRDRLLTAFDRASVLEAGPERQPPAHLRVRRRRVLGRRGLRRAALTGHRPAEALPRDRASPSSRSTSSRRTTASSPRSPRRRDAGSSTRSGHGAGTCT